MINFMSDEEFEDYLVEMVGEDHKENPARYFLLIKKLQYTIEHLCNQMQVINDFSNCESLFSKLPHFDIKNIRE